MATKPELLQQDSTAADSDLIMKTNSSNVTKTITASNFFSWLWGKIKSSTKSAADTSDPTAPINTTALNSSLADLQSGDANYCIPSKNTTKTYYLWINANNTPAGSTYCYSLTATRQSGQNGYDYLNQTCIQQSDSNVKVWERTAISSDGGTNWTWNDWQQLATKTTVNSYWDNISMSNVMSYTGKYITIPAGASYALQFMNIYATAEPVGIAISMKINTEYLWDWEGRSDNQPFISLNGMNTSTEPINLYIYAKSVTQTNNNHICAKGIIFN